MLGCLSGLGRLPPLPPQASFRRLPRLTATDQPTCPRLCPVSPVGAWQTCLSRRDDDMSDTLWISDRKTCCSTCVDASGSAQPPVVNGAAASPLCLLHETRHHMEGNTTELCPACFAADMCRASTERCCLDRSSATHNSQLSRRTRGPVSPAR